VPDETRRTATVDHLDAPFVGRRDEVAKLLRLLDRVRGGTPALVLVEGPAGIGKSALVRRFLQQAGDVSVLHASGEESEQHLDFGVLEQLFNAVGQRRPDDAEPALWGCRDGPVDPLVGGTALIEALGDMQRTGPVAVVIDDAHWGDRPSLGALTFALRRMAADRVLVLVVTRDLADECLPSGLARLLASDKAVRLLLDGLTSIELRALGAQIGTGPLSIKGAQRLQAHTAGNPLHARTLLEQLPASAFTASCAPLPAPKSYSFLVLAKLQSCGCDAERFVSAASVLGRRCPPHAAGLLADLDDPLPALEQACRAGLLVEDTATRTVEFPHPLIHAAVYQQVGVAKRTVLHLRAAQLTEDRPQQLRHRVLAATSPDERLANEVAEFGQQAMAAGQWSTASEHLESAARLSRGRMQRELRWLQAIECQLMSGDTPYFAALTAQVLTFCATAWRSYVLARVALAEGRLDEAEALLTESWERYDADVDGSLGARIAGQLAWLYVARDDSEQAVAWSDRAVGLAGLHGTSDVSHLIRLVTLGIAGRCTNALDSLGDLPAPTVASAADLDDLLGRARLRSWDDDMQGAYEDLTGVVKAVQGRSVTFQVLASAILAEVEYWLGRWDDSVIHSTFAASLAIDAEQGWLVSICHAIAAFTRSARGQWEHATNHVEAALSGVMHPGHVVASFYVASARAHLAAARNDPDQVIDVLQPLLAHDGSGSRFGPGIVMRWQDLLVDALVAIGRFDEALEVLEPFEARAAERRHHSSLAAAARARATLLSARHDVAGSDAAFDLAREHAEQVEMPFDRARLDLAHGEMLRRAGRRNAAAAHLRSALSTFDDLGAAPFVARCSRELAACGAAAARPARSSHGSLTPQEFAVAHLVGQGLSNRQVARELVISVKTVEYHLSHVYSKLRVSSRVQLASQMAGT
jgi:ATP/maltotriose-dependent transcriptional regulator MalT